MASTAVSTPAGARLRVWDLPLRMFHWLLVVAVSLALLSAEEGSPLNDWHILSGWIAGILVAFRVLWGFIGGEHARFARFVKPSSIGSHLRELMQGRPRATLGHNPLGALSVLVLLAMVGGTVWTGVILAEDVHEVLGWSLLALVVVHVIAVALMSLLTRENLVRGMIDGTKPADLHPSERDARAPAAVAYIIAGLVLATGAWAVTRYDPAAFTLRSVESYEHASEGGTIEQHDRRHDAD